MAILMFNQTIEILTGENKGMWRVVRPATSKRDFNALAYIPESITQWKKQRESQQPKLKWLWLSPDEVKDSVIREEIKFIVLNPHPELRKSVSELSGRNKEIREKREKITQRLINPWELSATLADNGKIYSLIREAANRCGIHKKCVYELFYRLCWYGFESGSLNPQYYNSGAPGVSRPWNESRPKVGAKPLEVKLGRVSKDSQIGITSETKDMLLRFFKHNKDPAKSFGDLYDDFIKAKYLSQYIQTDDGRRPVDPPKGSVPNQRQVRYALKKNIPAMERLAMKFHRKDWTRNRRGLKGHSWQYVSGPGHRYVIDATIGDIYLQSQINSNWSIGRPIIYFIVDTWSTAIVAFHVCLNGPSWDAAKVALFNMLHPELAAELWGIKFEQCLFPLPQLPYELMSDRGEHLSGRAAESAAEFGYHQLFNPAYEPDKKGLVEVFNRIAKDKQYGLIPGAIDARRREVEARTNPKDGLFTIRHYYKFVQGWVSDYNLHNDKSYRLDSEMIAKGIKPTPAELWKYGFDEMMGYGKETSFPKAVIHLLPRVTAAVNKKGIYIWELEYRYPEENDWTTVARNIGAFEINVHYYPGATELVFYCPPQSPDVVTLTLSPHARTAPHIIPLEWLDALVYSKASSGDHKYLAFIARLRSSVRNDDLVKQARDEKKAAELYQYPSLTATEARFLEKEPHLSLVQVTNFEDNKVIRNDEEKDSYEAAYDDLMSEVFKGDLELAGANND